MTSTSTPATPTAIPSSTPSIVTTTMPAASPSPTPKKLSSFCMLLLLYVPTLLLYYPVLRWLGTSTILNCLIPRIPGVVETLLFFDPTLCTEPRMRIVALEKEVEALRAWVDTSKVTVEASNIQEAKETKEPSKQDLENVRETLVTVRKELQEAKSANGNLEIDSAQEKQAQMVLAAMLKTRDGENKLQAAVIKSHEVIIAAMQHQLAKARYELQTSTMTCDVLRAGLANEQREKEALVGMNKMHQVQNEEVIESMEQVQDRLAKYDNALIAKDKIITQYREKSRVLQKRCDDAISRVDRLMEETRMRKEEELGVLGLTKEDMLESDGCEIVRLKGRIDELAWEVEKTREEREEMGRVHECTVELAGNAIARLGGKVHKLVSEMESMGECEGSGEEEELADDMPKMREVFDQVEIKDEAPEELLESSESAWDQVKTEAGSASP